MYTETTEQQPYAHGEKGEKSKLDFVSVCLYFLVHIIIVIFHGMATIFVSLFYPIVFFRGYLVS